MTSSKLSEEEWEELSEIKVFLEVFSEVTRILSGQEYPTLAQARFILDGVQEHLDNSKFKSVRNGGDLLRVMKDKLGKYLDDIKRQSALPSFFDLRYRDTLLERDDLALLASNQLGTSTSLKAAKGSSFFDDRRKRAKLDVPQGLHPEVQDYLHISAIDGCPLQWWKENEERFPNLAVLAKDHLSLLASSVPSERAFSDAGNIVTAKRTRLSPESVEAMMICNSFKKFQERKIGRAHV